MTLKRNEHKHFIEVEKIKANKEKEIQEAKINFFTIIAHEIRTPVSLIIGPLEKIMQSTRELPEQIFDNLKIISNKSKPKEFEFEVVGEGYDWFNYKDEIIFLNNRVGNTIDSSEVVDAEDSINGTYRNLEHSYRKYLKSNLPIKKLPFIKRVRSSQTDTWESNTTDVWLYYDELLNEYRIWTNQLGNDIKTLGRMRGNMQYLEDFWNVEIRPINFKYAYLGLVFTLSMYLLVL